jgi:glycerol-3-phosphate cytidylyltransferase
VMKRVMVDMSATLLHHGHVRLLKKAKRLGVVVCALTTDDEIFIHKGYRPELRYGQRKQLIQAIRYVDEVVPSPWLINEKFLDEHKIDLLVHGHDNSNHVSNDRLIVFPRTEGISSSILRGRVLESLAGRLLGNRRP